MRFKDSYGKEIEKKMLSEDFIKNLAVKMDEVADQEEKAQNQREEITASVITENKKKIFTKNFSYIAAAAAVFIISGFIIKNLINNEDDIMPPTVTNYSTTSVSSNFENPVTSAVTETNSTQEQTVTSIVTEIATETAVTSISEVPVTEEITTVPEIVTTIPEIEINATEPVYSESEITYIDAADFQKKFKEASINEMKSVLENIRTGITLNREDETRHMITAQAASLMNWAVGTSLTDDEIATICQEYKDEHTKGEIQSLCSMFQLVYEDYLTLLQEGQEQKLADAGCEDAAYPWSSNPISSIELLNEMLKITVW